MYAYNDVDACIDNGNINELETIFAKQPELLAEGYNGDSDSPLHYSAGYGSIHTCEYLINKGLSINCSFRKNDTPLEVAATENRIDIAQWLLANGAFVDGLDTSILSPMFSAVYFNHFEMVKLLVEHGANVNRMHIRNGRLPLDIALSRKYDTIAEYLKEKNAKSRYIAPVWIDEDTMGSYILGYVSLRAGIILPIDIASQMAIHPVSLKMAFANNEYNRLLFTYGLHKIHKFPIELFIALPQHWNFYIQTEENQFPILLLSKISQLIKNGMEIKEGDYILASDENYINLKWSNGIFGFFVSNIKWKTKTEMTSSSHDENLNLLTLVPIKKTKDGKGAKQSLEKNREAGWIKLTVDL